MNKHVHVSEAFKEGRQAAKEGLLLEDNPYTQKPRSTATQSNEYEWHEGYLSVGGK